MKKDFMFNFAISFISYLIVNIIGVLIFNLLAPSTGLLWEYIRDIFYNSFMGNVGGFIFFCIQILLSIFLPITMYMLVGSKLKQLGNRLLNYLSVSSSFIFLILIAITFFGFELKSEFYYFYLIFGYFTIFIFDIVKHNVLLFLMMSIIPSILIWLGMVYKSIKVRKYEKYRKVA